VNMIRKVTLACKENESKGPGLSWYKNDSFRYVIRKGAIDARGKGMALRCERREICGKEDDIKGYKTEDDSDICRVEEDEIGGMEDDRKDAQAGESKNAKTINALCPA
jgi:hypothetical protein